MLSIFLGTCEAVQAMHDYIAGPAATYPPSSSTSATSSKVVIREDGPDEDDEDETPLAPIDSQQQPLIGQFGHTGGEGAVEEDAGPSHVAGLGDEEGARIAGRLDPEPKAVGKPKDGQRQPWAHRDLKPGAFNLLS